MAATLARQCTFCTSGGIRVLTLPLASGGMADVRALAPPPSTKKTTVPEGEPEHPVAPPPDFAPPEAPPELERVSTTAIVPVSDMKRRELELAKDPKERPLDLACLEFCGASGAKPTGMFFTGGKFLHACKSGVAAANVEEGLWGDRIALHTTVRQLGDLLLVLCLEALPGGQGHALTAYHPPTCATFEAKMRTNDGSCPEKFCVERTVIAGVTLMFALAETAFPHALHLLVRDTSGDAELRLLLRDEAVFTMLPKKHRKLMSRCAEDLLKYGAVGADGAGVRGFTEVPRGFTHELDQAVVPVIRTPFSSKKEKGAGEPEGGHPVELLCSTTFFADGKHFRLSLTKCLDLEEFTIGLGEVNITNDGASKQHFLHLCDRRGETVKNPGIGLYGEVKELGDTHLLVVTFMDAAPRCCRIVVVEPKEQKMFQMVVVDSALGQDPLPLPDASRARREVLDTFHDGFSSPPAPGIAIAKAGPLAIDKPPVVRRAMRLIHRASRKLPSGQPVLLSVVREVTPDAAVRFLVLLYHPVTARELKNYVPNPLLDKILGACNCGDSATATCEMVDNSRKQVAQNILACVSVHPDGDDMELRAPKQNPLGQTFPSQRTQG